MTLFYHQRFFSDARNVATTTLLLLVVGFWSVPQAFLLVPVVALIGANQTAFDASYLLFARQYAAELEAYINRAMRHRVLVAAELEDRYLFPLNTPKIVTISPGRDISWFGWMTLLYTCLGGLAFVAGLVLGWQVLIEAGTGWTVFYLGSLTFLTAGSLLVGWWWFVLGTGEKRLRKILDNSFGRTQPD